MACAGGTTYNGLRRSSARPGDLVAVLGLGGLGHLGVQYAVAMGFETVAIAHGAEKADVAKQLGAHHYVDSTAATSVAQALETLGGARVARHGGQLPGHHGHRGRPVAPRRTGRRRGGPRTAGHGIRPMTETLPLDQAGEAYRKMLSGTARFRMVITTGR